MSQKKFILGKQEKSNREYVVAFVGTDIWAVKWRNMKIHFKTAEETHDRIVNGYSFPQVYDIKNDPSENYELWGNEGNVHTWIMEPVSIILNNLQASMVKYRNIKPGEEFRATNKQCKIEVDLSLTHLDSLILTILFFLYDMQRPGPNQWAPISAYTIFTTF